MDGRHHPDDASRHAPPSAGLRYALLMTVFSVGAGVLTHVTARRTRPEPTSLELTEAVLATFFIARMIAKEKIGAVRACATASAN